MDHLNHLQMIFPARNLHIYLMDLPVRYVKSPDGNTYPLVN